MPRRTTLGELLRATTRRHPDREALVYAESSGATDRRWTYAELLDDAERAARRLRQDFDPGEHLALWSGNRPEWLIVQFGAALAGLVLVPMNPAFTETEAEHLLADADAAGLIFDAEFRGVRRQDTADRLVERLPHLRSAVGLDEWSAWLAKAPAGIELPVVEPAEPAQILYTSGTTGAPKGAVLHHHGLTARPSTASAAFDLGEAPRWLNALPMFHVGGCGLPTVGSVSLGGTHILAERYQVEAVLELFGRERVTFFGGVPAMIFDLLARYDPQRHDVSALRALLSGAAAVSPTLIAEVERVFGVHFMQAYGQTEAHGHIAQTRAHDAAHDKAFTVGRPLPGIETRTVDPESMQPCAPGRPGELWCRSESVMLGYYGNAEASAHALPGAGWLRTGDICSVDERGFITFVGRSAEIINRGGEKFGPREIEDALGDHSAVSVAAVFGVPDERLGQRVVAFVVASNSAAEDAGSLFEQLSAHLRARVATFKIPQEWALIDELPRTASGKVARPQLATLWEQRGS